MSVYTSTPNPCVDGIIHTHLPTLCLVLSLYFSVQIQAVNAIGCSPLSPPLLARTRPLPPAPPPLECSAAGPQSLKLKWGENPGNTHTRALLADDTVYTLQMEDKNHRYAPSPYLETLLRTGFRTRNPPLESSSRTPARWGRSLVVQLQWSTSNSLVFQTGT